MWFGWTSTNGTADRNAENQKEHFSNGYLFNEIAFFNAR